MHLKLEVYNYHLCKLSRENILETLYRTVYNYVNVEFEFVKLCHWICPVKHKL